MWLMMTKNALHPWSLQRFRVGYSRSGEDGWYSKES